ncbi:MAG: iron ABC transporter permease [Xanthobacteraceae bacterium]
MVAVDPALEVSRLPRWRWRRPIFLLIVCIAIGLWLVLVPIAGLLVTAFTEDTGLGFGTFTLDNFAEAYSSQRIASLIGNSLIYAAGTAIVTFAIGGFIAWAVERTDAPGGTLFHNLALVAFAIPGLLMAMAWIFVLSPNIGWVNALAKSSFGVNRAPFDIYSMGGMIWALSSHYFPLAYLALGPALRALDVRMEEAGLVSGGRYWQVLPKITLPLLRPAILSGLLLLFIMGLSSYEVPRVIGLPARIYVFTTRIQDATTETPPEFGVASALSLALLAVCLLAVYFYRRATRNAEAFATITGKGYMPTRIALGRWRWPVCIAMALVFFVALGLPLFTLAWQSFFFNLSQPFMHSPPPATLANYAYILRYPIFLDAVRTSVVVSAMAATIVVALTLVMAWIARRSASRLAWLLDALASAPIAIPGVIVGASILFTYLVIPIGVYDTIWILLIAYVTLSLPYGMRFASSGIAQIHRELEEVAAVSGARLAQILWRVLLPLLSPFLLAAWIYTFVLSVRELGASIFLIGPGTNVLATISLTMWEEGGSYGAVAALGILQIVPLLVIVAGLRFLETRVQRRTRTTGGSVRPASAVSHVHRR